MFLRLLARNLERVGECGSGTIARLSLAVVLELGEELFQVECWVLWVRDNCKSEEAKWDGKSAIGS